MSVTPATKSSQLAKIPNPESCNMIVASSLGDYNDPLYLHPSDLSNTN